MPEKKLNQLLIQGIKAVAIPYREAEDIVYRHSIFSHLVTSFEILAKSDYSKLKDWDTPDIHIAELDHLADVVICLSKISKEQIDLISPLIYYLVGNANLVNKKEIEIYLAKGKIASGLVATIWNVIKHEGIKGLVKDYNNYFCESDYSPPVDQTDNGWHYPYKNREEAFAKELLYLVNFLTNHKAGYLADTKTKFKEHGLDTQYTTIAFKIIEHSWFGKIDETLLMQSKYFQELNLYNNSIRWLSNPDLADHAKERISHFQNQKQKLLESGLIIDSYLEDMITDRLI